VGPSLLQSHRAEQDCTLLGCVHLGEVEIGQVERRAGPWVCGAYFAQSVER